MNEKLLRIFFVSVFIVIIIAKTVQADGIKQIETRKDLFRGVKAHMSAIVAVAKKRLPFNEEARNHAKGILAFSQMLPRMFPVASNREESGTSPEVWKQPKKFKEELTTFRLAAENIAKADKDSWKAALGALGRSCKNCHKKFRKKR